MKFFKSLILINFISLYFFQSKSDHNALAQLSSSLNALVNYNETINQSTKKETLGIPWAEWYKRCKALPFFRKIGTDYTHKAIEWDELEKAIDKFIEVNTQLLSEAKLWLENAPHRSNHFFTSLDKPLDPIQPFVQKLIVKPGTRIAFHGDFHGDVHSMVEYIQRLNKDGYMNGFKIKASDFYLVFLGDYEDRGIYGAEVWYTLIQLKIANPNNVIIIRGNHEQDNLTYAYGFAQEFLTKFDPDLLGDLVGTSIHLRLAGIFKSKSEKLNKLFRIFDFLPPALYLGSGTNRLINFLLCVHGGIETRFNSTNLLSSQLPLTYQWLKYDKDFPTNLGNIGFMWSDFQVDPTYPNEPSSRGAGEVYGKEETEDFLHEQSDKQNKYELKGIFRAHQHGGIGHPMMDAILENNGIAKLWPDESDKNKDLWNNIVCTFLVGPDTAYGGHRGYYYDAFGILTTAEKYEDCKFEIQRNNIVPKNIN